MTCVRTPDPLDELDAHPYAVEADDPDERSGLARLVARLQAFISEI